MPASVYEPIGSALKKSLLGPRSSGLDSKMASSFQRSLLTPVSEVHLIPKATVSRFV